MIKYCLFITLAMVFLGCASTRVIHPDRPSDFSKISTKQDQKVRITLRDGRQITATKLQARPDSTSWYNTSLSRFQTVATPEIQEIMHHQGKQAAVVGLVMGMVAGTVAGAMIGASTCEDSDSSFIDLCFAPFAGGFAGFCLGGMAGAIIVGATGKTKYQFQTTTPDTLQGASIPGKQGASDKGK